MNAIFWQKIFISKVWNWKNTKNICPIFFGTVFKYLGNTFLRYCLTKVFLFQWQFPDWLINACTYQGLANSLHLHYERFIGSRVSSYCEKIVLYFQFFNLLSKLSVEIQFSKMDTAVPLVENSMKMGSFWESETNL